ncbi:venom dipeptidyl peptidase 4 isoform X2 [Drosophila gunungcola]|uniref:venom dipeptidyl peptidase 4 isoform X2 n=1 Tax=Drosophila gunungcola TaxID=103775 RepID=UPI0022E2DCF8|nr:venom dipeptidyl peptidase 4 isoform X2 [Drosophila gunungcola]XP_052848497.1 venom dipeptidyl peptidase 4 isoform X2 [Drosophila gunungcola]
MSAAGWLDMNAALQNLNSTPESTQKSRGKRRSSYAGRRASTAGVHGRGSIGSISSGIFKAFRERFLSSDDSGDYRKLRQRDAESGRMGAGANASSSTDSSGEDAEPSSSSSVEDLFSNEAERRKWQRKTSEQRRRTARKKNLMHTKEKKRRVRIILSVLTAVIAVALLATALVFILRTDEEDGSDDSNNSNNAIDLEDVLSGQLYAKRFNGSWSNGNSLIYKDNASIMEFDAKTGVRSVLLENSAHYVLYEKSADGLFLLLAKNYRKNFRYSFLAEYDLYDLNTKTFTALTIQNVQQYLSMVQWAPVGNALVINFNRNLYYKQSALETEIAITSDEQEGVLNGIPDWVYEEEVFSSNVATWFNPSGDQLAFIKFDDSSTIPIRFPYYGDAGDLRYQYPLHQSIAYPKAGSSNPRVELVMVDLNRAVSGKDFLTVMPVPPALNTETDYIVTVVSWVDDTHVLSIWMNRIQNAAYVVTFDGLSRSVIYSAESKTGWVDLYTAPFRNRNGSRLAFVLPHNNYKHVQLLSSKVASAEPQTLEPLTEGKYVVDSILHWDGANDIIFYTANTEDHPEQLHLYAIRALAKQNPKCLTCNLITSGDVPQTYFSATFNDNNHIVITSLGPGIPTTHIYEWKFENSQVVISNVIDWETNESLRAKLKGVALPSHKILTVNIDGGFQAKVLLQLPPNLDTSGATKYPMLVDVYGGPDSYSVTNKWMVDWGTYLTSNQSVIYAKIDGRGSGLRGESLLHAIYLKLGTVEISDQINVTATLSKMYNYIDADHVGIWGWSYGGYAAAMALANDNSQVFKCAASIAPVTDWAYYDSIYTERYMGLPNTNEVGYANSRLSTMAVKLRGKKYLLVHGTLDDNVHYQQAMILAKNLERQDILFKQISYADEDHGLANVRPHLYHSLDRFFGDCFASSRLMKSAK